LHSLKDLGSSGVGVGALEFGARENFMKWCLGGRCMGQKSLVEV
jgi:hypothetical protein